MTTIAEDEAESVKEGAHSFENQHSKTLRMSIESLKKYTNKFAAGTTKNKKVIFPY